MTNFCFCVCGVFCFLSVFLLSAAVYDGPMVLTSDGFVEGKYLTVNTEDTGQVTVSAFLGIPFAEPPVKNLRFRAPIAVVPWNQKVKLTVNFGPTCFHEDDTVFPGFLGAEMWNAPNQKSEDCLYLNVWTRDANKRHPDNRLAVMVWIYGGSFFSGTTALPLYDGRYLAAVHDVVVVSINYRLGPLGFLPPLNGEIEGNAGLLDQQLGLKWVKENIVFFGGDPDRITLFGESAGAASVALHTLAPSSSGLFHRIILQSGNQITPWSTVPLKTALNRTWKFAANLECPKGIDEAALLTCLRSKSAAEIFRASWVSSKIFDFPFVPVSGTSFLPQDPHMATRDGRQSEVDVLTGFNTNEGSYFAIYTVEGFNISTASLINKSQFVEGIKRCGLRTNEFGKYTVEFFYSNWTYPKTSSQYRDGINNIVGDFHIECPTKHLANLHSNYFPSRNIYLYHLDYRISTNPWPAWAGVMHGYEIELVFGLPWFGNFTYAQNYSDQDRMVSRRMVRYWTNFAKFGNPNGPNSTQKAGEISWPKYDASSRKYLKIQESHDVVLQPTTRSLQCAFWEHYMPSLLAATNDLNEVETKWKVEFHRWSHYMDSWNKAYRDFTHAREQDCGN